MLVALLALVCSGCGDDDGPVATLPPSTSVTTAPSTSVGGDGVGPEADTDTDPDSSFEFVITDLFTSDDGGAVVLVGRQHAGTLRPGDVVETYSVGPASRATVVQIDRVTPSPLIRDVDRLVEGESGNIELAGPVADDYIQGQTLVPAS